MLLLRRRTELVLSGDAVGVSCLFEIASMQGKVYRVLAHDGWTATNNELQYILVYRRKWQ